MFCSSDMPKPSALFLHEHFGEALKDISKGMSISEAADTYEIP
jgi:hypothetical protein